MHKPESIQENVRHKILRGFEIQTNYPIPTRRPDQVLIKKKKRTCHLVDFAVPVNHRVKMKESKKIDKHLDPDETVEHDGNINCTWCVWKGTGNQRKDQDHSDPSIVKIG